MNASCRLILRWTVALLPLAVWFGAAVPSQAQPTYKLNVRPHLKPHATLALDGITLKRSPVADDPGFRLQYHIKKDGKTVRIVEARSSLELEVPHAETGTYTAELELFHPTYKTGSGVRKGEYKPISNVLTYKVEPGEPPKVILVSAPMPEK
ncbi:MAG: hypothetical protein ACK4RK_08060 [Gemmataceae bacterium]